jgi:hypothetical protein
MVVLAAVAAGGGRERVGMGDKGEGDVLTLLM